MDIIGILDQLWAWVCGHWGLILGAGVPLYALSTYDTDYIMVKADQAARAETALIADGHTWLGHVTGTV